MNGIEQGAHRDARGESRFRHRFSPRRAGILAALACVLATAAPAAAQQAIAGAPENPASALAHDRQTDIPDTLRQQLETIGEYADEVRHRTGRPDAAPMHPMDAAPPPDAAAARVSPEIDLPADPFEVSPRLREASGARFSGLPDVSTLELQRRVHVRAVLRTPHGALAQLLINDKEVVTLMDKELIDLGDLGVYQAEIQADAVALSNPNNPQGKKVVLR